MPEQEQDNHQTTVNQGPLQVSVSEYIARNGKVFFQVGTMRIDAELGLNLGLIELAQRG